MTKLDKSDCAWAAGFFEGEGCISIPRLMVRRRRQSPEYRVLIRITNTDPRPLSRLQYLFGGHIHERKTKPPCIRAFVWEPQRGTEQLQFLKAILPFLCFKQEQVNIAIAMRKTLGEGRKRGRRIQLEVSLIAYREELRLRLKELNRRGRPRTKLELQLPIARKTKQNQLELNLGIG